jgi:S1-C subfamily serine protease
MSRASRLARRPRRRALAAAALVLPLLTVPAAPAVAAVSTVDARGYVGAGSPWGFGGGQPFGGWYGGFGGGFSTEPGYQTQTTTTQDASAATTAESTGVVLIDTVVGYDQGEAAGTGLVIGSDGTVVTNHHVVAGATSITVTVPSTGKRYDATVVGYDATHDVAVLRLADASGLSTVATDPTVSVGEAVAAVGNAEGGGALTAADGQVLARRTAIDVTEDDGSSAHLAGLIEDSADVVPGDSGGALLDGDDEVVGMTVAASSGSVDVTGYAIPIARVLRIAHQILAGQASSTITLGAKAALGVEIDSRTSTPYVAGVVDGGAAAQAGIVAGDTITSLDGTAVSSYSALTSAIGRLRPGDRVSVGWTDAGGAAHTATVTLGTGPVG